MVNEHEFKKQFGNIGIDRNSVLGASGPNSLHNNSSRDKVNKDEDNNDNNDKLNLDESNEILLIKRKMEYLQNNIVAKFNEKIEELDKKIDLKISNTVNYNREFTYLKNEVEEINRKIKNIKVVFTEAPLEETKKEASFERSNNEVEKKQNPGNIKVEDYFNFSNKKFD